MVYIVSAVCFAIALGMGYAWGREDERGRRWKRQRQLREWQLMKGGD